MKLIKNITFNWLFKYRLKSNLCKQNSSSDCLVFDALMLMHLKNCYPKLKCNPKINNLQQFNAAASFLKYNKWGVHPNNLNDFEFFIKRLCNLLWEIDANYEKLKAHQCPFPGGTERTFLNFNKPQRIVVTNQNSYVSKTWH